MRLVMVVLDKVSWMVCGGGRVVFVVEVVCCHLYVMCTLHYIYCKKTSCNWFRPVFFSLLFFVKPSDWQLKNFRIKGNCNWWSSLLHFGSVQFQSYFQSSQLDLRTLFTNHINMSCMYSYSLSLILQMHF
jgi:hypothetical protein